MERAVVEGWIYLRSASGLWALVSCSADGKVQVDSVHNALEDAVARAHQLTETKAKVAQEPRTELTPTAVTNPLDCR